MSLPRNTCRLRASCIHGQSNASSSTTEVGAVCGIARVRICAGGAQQWAFLPRQYSRESIAASGIYLISPSFAGFVAGKAIDEAGKAAFNPVWGSLMAEISSRDPSRRGRTMGLLDASDDAGSIAGPILASMLLTSWGVGVMLTVRIALAVFTELYAIVLLRRLRPAAEQGDSRPAETTAPS